LILLVLAPGTYSVARADRPEATEPKETPKQLSVAPLDHVDYPSDRPEWIKQSLGFDTDAVRIVVVSGPCETPEESMEELELMQRAAVSTYVSRFSESNGHDFYPISDEEIEHGLAVRRYSGEVMQGDTIKYEDAVELCFTQEKRDEIAAAWTNVEVRERLGAVGVMTFFGLAMLICSSALIGVFSRRIERRDQVQASVS
jgi:hypothetical protein